MEKNDNIYFMIVSKVGKTDGEWDLGRIFLYKYQKGRKALPFLSILVPVI